MQTSDVRPEIRPDVRLVPARAEHLDVWLEIRAGATSRRLLPLEEVPRESLLRRLSESSSDILDLQATSFRWMVESEGRIIGTVSARELSRFHGRVEVGYMLAEGSLGRGLGTRAVALLLERLYTIPSLHHIWLTTTVANLASQGVARKLGFRLEGVLRGHCIVQGERMDQQVWGLLRPEWEARRGELSLEPPRR
ncbi:GNAT family protein [Stigmatella sp. ncwal1]|uniref:GNAT family protein n=1 Tax=Stigmatella ashevillensis TaxID=2995309 RepID=A0ABT5DJT8_9BACT|nr:GNAT family protein [Stigmatella ashevillena]MDC0713924.1 GNAT family protein [Stigmatella ashevillena]